MCAVWGWCPLEAMAWMQLPFGARCDAGGPRSLSLIRAQGMLILKRSPNPLVGVGCPPARLPP